MSHTHTHLLARAENIRFRCPEYNHDAVQEIAIPHSINCVYIAVDEDNVAFGGLNVCGLLSTMELE